MIRNRALRHYLHGGGVVAYPTESCFGLGCDPLSRLGVQRILRLKRRPQHKGLILIASQWQQLRPFIAPLSAEQITLMNQYWPGPHTWLVPASQKCPVWLKGRHKTIAVRVTAHSGSRKLCAQTDMALVSTSANRSGGKATRTFKACSKLFTHGAQILPGLIGKSKRPSTIRDLLTQKVIRP